MRHKSPPSSIDLMAANDLVEEPGKRYDRAMTGEPETAVSGLTADPAPPIMPAGGVRIPDTTARHAEFRIGKVFSKSFIVYTQNFLPFVFISAVILMPTLIFAVLLKEKILSGFAENSVNIMVLGIEYAELILGDLIAAALAFGTYQYLCGRTVSFGTIVRRGLPMVFPVIGISLITYILAMIGFVLLVVPGLIITTIYMVAVPAATVERQGILKSLARSSYLTRGFRWPVFGAIFLFSVIDGIISNGSVAIGGVFIDMAGGAGLLTEISGVGMLVGYFIKAAIWAFYGVLITVIYHELRIAKEGGDAEQIAAVFD